MNISFLLSFSIFLINFNLYLFNRVIIPFSTYSHVNEDPEAEFNATDFYNNYFLNKMYAKMNLGTPKKYVACEILSGIFGLLIGEICQKNHIYSEEEKSTYDKNKSSTFYRVPDRYPFPYSNLEGIVVGDAFYFYNDTKLEEQIMVNNTGFLYLYEPEPYNQEKNESINICGRLGLAIQSTDAYTSELNLVKMLKKADIIQDYDFSLYFLNDTEGLLIIGEKPHITLPDILKEEKLKIKYVEPGKYGGIVWGINFKNVYYKFNGEEKYLEEVKRGYFSTEYSYIIGTEAYKRSIEENFFGDYLKKNICYYVRFKRDLRNLLICNKTDGFSPDKFPTLYFASVEYNYTFELKKEDLFLEKQDKYIFLIIFRENEHDQFTFGSLFFKKYFLTFNQMAKTIGVYITNKSDPDVDPDAETDGKNGNGENGSNNTLKIVLIGVGIVLLFAVGGVLLAMVIYKKKRKQRKNELDDNYDYDSKEENIINNEEENLNNGEKDNTTGNDSQDDKRIIVEN